MLSSYHGQKSSCHWGKVGFHAVSFLFIAMPARPCNLQHMYNQPFIPSKPCHATVSTHRSILFILCILLPPLPNNLLHGLFPPRSTAFSLLGTRRSTSSTRSRPRLVLLLHPLRIPHQLVLGLLVARRNEAVEEAAGTTLRMTLLLGLLDLVMKVAGGFLVELGVVLVFVEVGCRGVLACG